MATATDKDRDRDTDRDRDRDRESQRTRHTSKSSEPPRTTQHSRGRTLALKETIRSPSAAISSRRLHEGERRRIKQLKRGAREAEVALGEVVRERCEVEGAIVERHVELTMPSAKLTGDHWRGKGEVSDRVQLPRNSGDRRRAVHSADEAAVSETERQHEEGR